MELIKMPTLQETFDTVVHHLRRQNQKSMYLPVYEDSFDEQPPDMECAYRGENGLMCAAGCLIPDELYKEEFEGMSPVDYDDMRYPHYHKTRDELTKVFTDLGHEIKLVLALQKIHDNYEVPEWEEQFQRVADKFGLVLKEKTC